MGETDHVRQVEEIDLAALGKYLQTNLAADIDTIEVEQFPAGSSNLTYLVRVGNAEYVLRRPPFGNTVRSAHDMDREFNVLSKLSAVYSPAPKPFFYCDDASVIGADFYLMERRTGLVIRGTIPGTDSTPLEIPARSKGTAATSDTCLHSGIRRVGAHDLEHSQDARLAVCRSFIENLADLHALDYRAAGLGDLGKPQGYCRRQVEGWRKRYFATKTDEWPDLEASIAWLNDNIPADTDATLVHNDYKFDNVMLDPGDLTSITAVLDWEMVTVGDPLMDLGTTLGYWMAADAGEGLLNMPFNPRVLMENISRQQLAEMYAAATGRDISNILFYYVFGTFKIAVIAQQIYARYVKGFTKDARFARFNSFVAALGHFAAAAIKRRSI